MHTVVPLVGVSHRPPAAQVEVLELAEGDQLLLEREPDNTFDANAIKVVHPLTLTHLGYIPAKFAVDLAPLLDQGDEIECHVFETNGKAPRLGLSIAD